MRDKIPEIKNWDAITIWLLVFSILLIIFSFFSPYIFTRYTINTALDFTNTGTIGDTIGGIMNPFIALVGVIVTFLAFYMQIKANIQQKEQFIASINNQIKERKEQDHIWKVERFETKFYELLRLHKENISEISINGYHSKIEKRKAFVSMYKELRYSFFVTKTVYNEMKSDNLLSDNYDDIDLVSLSYIFFYAGVGNNSNKMTKAYLGQDYDITFYNKLKDTFENIRKHYKYNMSQKLELEELGEAKLDVYYPPFSGHISRLGHYYRHLFQTVKYVVNQEDSLISEDSKLEYLRTLRAQLSDHEQVLLYYNGIIGFGQAWIDFGYFTKYKMIHNLPLALADFGLTPQQKFKHELEQPNDIFEWLS